MTLPASQYSVLDAKRIERIDDDTFRCYVGGIQFFNFAVEPVLTVSVIVTERGPTVKLLSTKVDPSADLPNVGVRAVARGLCICRPIPKVSCVSSQLFAQLEGSPAVEAANDRFQATMVNDVRWASSSSSDLLELTSDTSIQVWLL